MKVDRIKHLLPGVFQRTLRPGNPLLAVLEVMEALHAPAETAIANFDAVLDPRRTPDAFVPELARWVDLDRLFEKRLRGKDATIEHLMPSGLGCLRELIAAAAFLSQWRGTRQGLIQFLEIATGISGYEIDEQVPGAEGRPRPFHIRVACPAAAARHRSLIQQIVELEKPAYVTYELAFAPANDEHQHAETND